MKSFDDLIHGKLGRQPQKGYGSYYNKLPRRYHIDWSQSREGIKRQVRVHAKPNIPAYTYLLNHAIFINKVSHYNAGKTAAHGSGYIVKVFSDKRFVMACADGWLLVEDYDIYPELKGVPFKLHFAKGARLD